MPFHGGYRRGTLFSAGLIATLVVGSTVFVSAGAAITVAPAQTVTQTSTFSTVPAAGVTGQAMTGDFGTVQKFLAGTGDTPCPGGLGTVTITWGDGTTSAPAAATPDANGRIPVTGQHAYLAPGTYDATAASSDLACSVAQESVTQQQISVGGVVVAVNTNTNHHVLTNRYTITAAPTTDPAQTGSPGGQGVAGQAAQCTKKKKKAKKKSAAVAKKCKKKK